MEAMDWSRIDMVARRWNCGYLAVLAMVEREWAVIRGGDDLEQDQT